MKMKSLKKSLLPSSSLAFDKFVPLKRFFLSYSAVITRSESLMTNYHVSTPLSINVQESGRSIFVASDTYSKSESNARYWQQSDLLQLNHPSDTRYLRFSADHGSNVQQRYRGGGMIIRRVNSSNTSVTVLTFSSTNQNIVCAGSISSNSDRALKDNETPITVQEAGMIIDNVQAKKYTRNDTGEDRHGFISQDLEAVCAGNFAHIVGSTPATDDEGEEIEGAAAIKTVDYSRLVALLWTTVRDLRSRVQELESSQP